MNVLSRQNPSRVFWDLHYYSMCCTTPAGRLSSWSCIGSQAKSNHTAVWPAGQSFTLWIERETMKWTKAVELHQVSLFNDTNAKVLETDRKTKSRSLLSGFPLILPPPPPSEPSPPSTLHAGPSGCVQVAAPRSRVRGEVFTSSLAVRQNHKDAQLSRATHIPNTNR